MTDPIANDLNTRPTATIVRSPRQRSFMHQSRRYQVAGFFWRLAWSLLARWTPRWCNRWRIGLLRCFGATIGRSSYVDRTVIIFRPWNLTLADHVTICHCVILNCIGSITIDANTRISQYSHLCAGAYDYHDPKMTILPGPINVGQKVWLGADVFVGPSATIGDHTIVGARSSVFNALPDHVIAVGEPCKPVRQYKTD